MDPQSLIESKSSEIDNLCRRFHVHRLRLFGSALSDNWDEAVSDFDFLVDYQPAAAELPPLDRLVGMKLALEDLLGRGVDVVDVAAARNQLFIRLAESHAKELYAA